MMALTPTAFAVLLATCAPGAPANYIAGIAKTESAFHPFALHDNTTGKSFTPGTHKEAVALARDFLKAGHSLDVGLMQVNATNWAWLGLTVETALDPCKNVAAGARVLESFSRYNTGSPTRGFERGYVQKVNSNLHGPGPIVALPIPPKEPPKQSRVFASPKDSSRHLVVSNRGN